MRRVSDASSATQKSVAVGAELPSVSQHRVRVRNGAHSSTVAVNARLARELDPPPTAEQREAQGAALRERAARKLQERSQDNTIATPAALEGGVASKSKAPPGGRANPANGGGGATATTTAPPRAPHQGGPKKATATSREQKPQQAGRGSSPSRRAGSSRPPAHEEAHRSQSQTAFRSTAEHSALEQFQTRFAGAFRPLSVCSDTRRSRTPLTAAALGDRSASSPVTRSFSANNNHGDGDSSASSDGDVDGSAGFAPRGAGKPRAATPGPASISVLAAASAARRKEADVMKRRAAAEGSRLRKATRGYVRAATEALRGDTELLDSFSHMIDEQQRARRSESRPASRATTVMSHAESAGATTIPVIVDADGDERLPHYRMRKPVSAKEALDLRHHEAELARDRHKQRCAAAYEAKQQHLLEDYLRFEEELVTNRGEKFSRPRWFIMAMTTLAAHRCFSAAVERGRQERTHAVASKLCAQHASSPDHDGSKVSNQSFGQSLSPPRSSANRRRSSLMTPAAAGKPSATPKGGALGTPADNDVILGVHRAKFASVEARRDRYGHFDITPDLNDLIRTVRPFMGYWARRWLRRRRQKAVDLLTPFLQQVYERARVGIHVRVYLKNMRVIVRRWREAFAREQRRVDSIAMQFDHYYSERVRYNKDLCVQAERDIKRRERSALKVAQQRRQTMAATDLALAAVRLQRKRVDLAQRAPSVAVAGAAGAGNGDDGGDALPPELLVGDTTGTVAGMSELQIARLIAAPLLVPNPYGARLGPDPASARFASLATQKALNVDKITFLLPARTKTFVVKFLIARERIAFSFKITAWTAAMKEAHIKHEALVLASGFADGPSRASIMQEIEEFRFPPLPRRQVFLSPNEMRFWIHIALLLYGQERRVTLEHGIRTDKYVDPDAVEQTYGMKNVNAVFRRAASQLGEKLTGIRPGYFDDLPHPVEVALPQIPSHLLPPGAAGSTAEA